MDSQQGVVLQIGDWARGLTTSRHKKTAFYEVLHRALELDGFFAVT
jgi:hypothetical protein